MNHWQAQFKAAECRLKEIKRWNSHWKLHPTKRSATHQMIILS